MQEVHALSGAVLSGLFFLPRLVLKEKKKKDAKEMKKVASTSGSGPAAPTGSSVQREPD